MGRTTISCRVPRLLRNSLAAEKRQRRRLIETNALEIPFRHFKYWALTFSLQRKCALATRKPCKHAYEKAPENQRHNRHSGKLDWSSSESLPSAEELRRAYDRLAVLCQGQRKGEKNLTLPIPLSLSLKSPQNV